MVFLIRDSNHSCHIFSCISYIFSCIFLTVFTFFTFLHHSTSSLHPLHLKKCLQFWLSVLFGRLLTWVSKEAFISWCVVSYLWNKVIFFIRYIAYWMCSSLMFSCIVPLVSDFKIIFITLSKLVFTCITRFLWHMFCKVFCKNHFLFRKACKIV